MGKLLKLLIVLVVVLALGVWFGVPALMETAWARDEVKSALEQHTKRDVEVGSISFGWWDGLKVGNVTVKQRKDHLQSEGPLFHLDGLSLDVSFRDVLDRKINVEDLTVRGPEIVVVRDENGVFNFSDLLAQPSTEPPAPERPGGGTPPGGGGGEKKPTPGGGSKGPDVTTNINIKNGKLVYVDQKLGTRIDVEDLESTVKWINGRLDLDMDFLLNGGKARLRSHADLSKSPAPFEIAELTVDGSTLTADLAPMGYVIPLLGEHSQNASGTINLSLKNLTGTGFDLPSLQRTLSGAGGVSLKGGAVVSDVVAQLHQAIQAINAGDINKLLMGGDARTLAIEFLQSNFRIADGKVISDAIEVKGADLEMALSGWTRLDGALAYDMQIKGLSDVIAKQPELEKILGSGTDLLPLALAGTLTSPTVEVDVGSTLQKAAEGLIKDKLGGELEKKLGGDVKKKVPGLGGLIDGLGGKKKK